MQRETDRRAEGRSNVFLSATLQAGADQYAVRIRNISSHGALIDGAKFPGQGTKVCLSRGILTVAGQLAWQDGHYGGITFDTQIDVDSWTQRTGHRGQQRVDMLVTALKRSEPVPEHLEAAMPTSLAQMSAELNEVCERLANLPGMSATLAEELVRLDSLAQRLGAFARTLEPRE